MVASIRKARKSLERAEQAAARGRAKLHEIDQFVADWPTMRRELVWSIAENESNAADLRRQIAEAEAAR